jgi:hypothetical protein
MPQGQGRKSAEEILGLAPSRKSPEEILGITPQPSPPPESFYQKLKRNVGLGLEQLGQKVSDVVASGAEIGGGIVTGDFRPLLEAGERLGRGAIPLIGALSTPYTPGQTYAALSAEQAPKIQEVHQRQAERREKAGDVYFRGSQIENARLEAEASKDLSLLGKITRGLPQVLPYIAAGVASGGSVPALAATGAVMELNQPENIPLSAGLASVPLPAIGPAVKAGAGAIRRALGRAGEQALEAEIPSITGAVTEGGVEDLARSMGTAGESPTVRRALGLSEQSGLQNTIEEGAAEISPSVAHRVKSGLADIYHGPRALMASADISAPLRQGALLTIPPSQWGRAAKAGVRMFEAFSTKRYERIVEEIGSHPDAEIAQASGLHLSTQMKEGLRKTEEDFISRYADKIPIVKHSQQAYETYLDSLRMDTFAKYKRVIDAQDFTPLQKQIAYEGAAKWINIASGRGSLGQTLDKAMPALNNIFFAPRYVASRLNVLNPVMYAKNSMTAEGRVILKQQMSELMQFAGMTAATYGLAKAAGADVSLSPSSPDFLKIKFGNYRYDPLAGLQQVMRLVYRIGADISIAAQGKKAQPGESALDIGSRFLRSKLGPVPSYFADFLTRRTFTGEPFQPMKGAVERVTPIMWQDFIDAYQREGLGGVAKVSPGMVGVGVQNYEQKPLDKVMERAKGLSDEYERLSHPFPSLRREQKENDNAFNTRQKVFGEALEHHGLRLVGSDQYRQAPDEVKLKALNLLSRRISNQLHHHADPSEAGMLEPSVIMGDVFEAGQERQ